MSYLSAIAQTRRSGKDPSSAQDAVPSPRSRLTPPDAHTFPPAYTVAPAPLAPAAARVAETYMQTASFFVMLRQYLNLTREQAAYQLGTHPAIVAALETGDMSALPAWPQTHRIVSNYAALAGIDPGPALHCLEACLNALPPQRSPQGLPSLPPFRQDPSHRSSVATIAGHEVGDEDGGVGYADTGPTMTQRLFASMPAGNLVIRAAVVVAMLAVAGLFAQSTSLQAAMTRLPAPVGSLFREVREAILLRTSGKFEGLIWIDVSDPRSRKDDKLPVKNARKPVRN